MARSAIPDFGIEYPPYEYRPYPRYVGATIDGEAIIANDEKEFKALKGTEYFPRVMGKDKNGKEVIAQIPRDLEWLKASVVTPPEDPAVVAKREADRIAAEAEAKRKAEAYDKMMAEQGAKKDPTADAPTATDEQQPPTGLKKSKAA